MSKSRSVSRSVTGGTISIDASYAQELVEFWTGKYEQVKEELDQIKEASVATPPSPPSSLSDGDGKGAGPSSTTEFDKVEVDTLKAHNEGLRNKLAANEQQRLELSQEIQALLAQNVALAFEADVSRQQKITNLYLPVAFFPAAATPLTLKSSSAQTLSEKFSTGALKDHQHCVCFLPRPPACLPIRVNACGQHGYWFSPPTTCPENLEFELVVEGKANEWTYLGRYKSVHLPGGEMRLSEWLVLDDETKGVHCTRVAAKGLGQDAAIPETVSAAAIELKRQYDSGQAAVPCFTLVCTGFTTQVHATLHEAATHTRKRKSNGKDGGKRVKREQIRDKPANITQEQ